MKAYIGARRLVWLKVVHISEESNLVILEVEKEPTIRFCLNDNELEHVREDE